jgi:hypothetical protein
MALFRDFQKGPFSVTLNWFQGLIKINQMLKQVQHDTSLGSMSFHLPLLKILTKEAVVFILALNGTMDDE